MSNNDKIVQVKKVTAFVNKNSSWDVWEDMSKYPAWADKIGQRYQSVQITDEKGTIHKISAPDGQLNHLNFWKTWKIIILFEQD